MREVDANDTSGKLGFAFGGTLLSWGCTRCAYHSQIH